MAGSGGPRNFDENRLKKPPKPEGKGKIHLRLMKVLNDNFPVCSRGYYQIMVDPVYYDSNRSSKQNQEISF